jgi:hypothetical protein
VPSPAARPPAAAQKPQQPAKTEDKVTLILHPQPKAAPGRLKPATRPMTAKEALQAKAARRGLGAPAKPASLGVGGEASATDALAQRGSGPTELREEWLRASSADATHVLAEAERAAPELIAAWQQHANVAALTAVAWGHEPAGPGAELGPMRKAARRALNVLRARGITVPEPPSAAPAGARPPLGAVEDPGPPTATFVPPDANGMTFFSVSQRLAGGRYRVADVVLREGLGILHASSGRLPGKQIRRWKARVEARLGAAPVEVPLEWARYRVAEARQQNDKSGQVLPLGLDGCQSLFTPVPAEAPHHPIAQLEQEIGAAEISQAVAASAALHNEPELRSWLPDRPALDELLRQVGAKLGPAGGSDQKLVDTTLAEELDSATDRFFSPDVRAALAERMRDSAISVRKRAGDATARQVLCVARAIREAGIITSPPHEIPFLVSFFRKAIAVLARQGDGRLQVPVPRPAAGEAELPSPAAEQALGGAEPLGTAEDLLHGGMAQGDAETEGDSDEDEGAPAG